MKRATRISRIMTGAGLRRLLILLSYKTCPGAHTITSTVMLVSHPKTSTTLTQMVCLPGLS